MGERIQFPIEVVAMDSDHITSLFSEHRRPRGKYNNGVWPFSK